MALEQGLVVVYSWSDSLGLQVAGLNAPEDIDESVFGVGEDVEDLYGLKLVDSVVEQPVGEVEREHGAHVGEGLDEMDPRALFLRRFLDEAGLLLPEVLVHLLVAVLQHLHVVAFLHFLHAHRCLPLLLKVNVVLHYAGMHLLELLLHVPLLLLPVQVLLKIQLLLQQPFVLEKVLPAQSCDVLLSEVQPELAEPLDHAPLLLLLPAEASLLQIHLALDLGGSGKDHVVQEDVADLIAHGQVFAQGFGDQLILSVQGLLFLHLLSCFALVKLNVFEELQSWLTLHRFIAVRLGLFLAFQLLVLAFLSNQLPPSVKNANFLARLVRLVQYEFLEVPKFIVFVALGFGDDLRRVLHG